MCLVNSSCTKLAELLLIFLVSFLNYLVRLYGALCLGHTEQHEETAVIIGAAAAYTVGVLSGKCTFYKFRIYSSEQMS